MVPRLTVTRLAGPRSARDDTPVLVVGPSLGTAVAHLWEPVLGELSPRVQVLGWDLPGDGASQPCRSFGLEDVAHSLLAHLPGRFAYAGVSAGGAVGLHLALQAPGRVRSLAAICTGAVIGTAGSWHERADVVDQEGLGPLVPTMRERWFSPSFDGGHDLVAALTDVDPASYAACCRALANHDVRSRLTEIEAPVLAVAGGADIATPIDRLAEIADGVHRGRLHVLDGAAHLPTVERPAALAAALKSQAPGSWGSWACRQRPMGAPALPD